MASLPSEEQDTRVEEHRCLGRLPGMWEVGRKNGQKRGVQDATACSEGAGFSPLTDLFISAQTWFTVVFI